MIVFLTWLLSVFIKGYQRLLSPLLGPKCRFYPSCSQYALLSLQKDSFFTAIRKIVSRLSRCHPFHSGGVDWP